jgi:hypothetical protein
MGDNKVCNVVCEFCDWRGSVLQLVRKHNDPCNQTYNCCPNCYRSEYIKEDASEDETH